MSPLNVKQVFCSQWSCRAVTPPAGGTTVLLVPDGAAGTGQCCWYRAVLLVPDGAEDPSCGLQTTGPASDPVM